VNPLSKSIWPGIIIAGAILFVFSCRADISTPYFEDGPLEVHFPNLQGDEFQSMKSFEDKESGSKYTKYLSKGKKPNLAIAKQYTSSAYDDIQVGRREVCPPDFMPGIPKEILTVPSHTEVLNDTSFLLGTLWYEFEHGHIPRKRISGKIGWQATIISPESAIYIYFWQEIESISADSLLNWGLEMREEVVIGFKDY